MYKELAIYFLVLFLAGLACFRLFFRHKKKFTAQALYLRIAFIAYLAALVALTIVPAERFRLDNTISHFNFVPVINLLKRLYTVVNEGYYFGIKNALQNLVGNILLFVPLGFFLAQLFQKNLREVIVIAALASCSIEFFQYLNRILGYYRHIDIDDVLLNILGACFGFLVLQATRKNRSSNKRAWKK